MKKCDLVIIGAGPAGMTAAIYATRANLNVVLLDRFVPGGQIVNTHEIQNYTGVGTINGAELAYKMFEHTQELNIEFNFAKVKCISIEDNLKNVICEDGQIFQAKSVIISTGTKARKLNIEGENNFIGLNISWCAICDGPYYRGKDVVVIGGGNSAVEESIYLSNIANSINIVTINDLSADPISCDKIKNLKNVTINTYSDVVSFIGDSRLRGVKIKSRNTGEEKIINCDGVFEYIGLIPSTEEFKNLGILNKSGYIKVDKNMETSIEGIFGAGDVNEKDLRQVLTAASDGAIAAQSAFKYIENLKKLS